MSTFVRSLVGGVGILAVAGLVGVAQNAVRPNPVRLWIATPSSERAGRAEAGNAARPGESPSPSADAPTAPGSADAPAAASDAASALERRIRSGSVIVIDARSPEAFADGHIPGAINVPYDRLPQYLDELQSRVAPDDSVVCYCWSESCDFSDQLAEELRLMGYTAVDVFEGGWEAWNAAGLPVESGAGGDR